MIKLLKMRFIILLIISTVVLSACSTSRYNMRHDAAPLRKPTLLEQLDAKVIKVKKSIAASRTYTVRGKKYTPLLSESGYENEGIASWYGRKFHGHLTSNGETYDMFSMTAAHKTLPLPSFVEVTNLVNGKTAIVKINDRGPFHDNRLIDLSYAAAYKLGIYQSGTGRVKIKALVPNDKTSAMYIQVLAATNYSNVQLLANKLSKKYQLKNKINQVNGIYRLHLGPIKDPSQAKDVLNSLKQNSHKQAFLLYSQDKL
ncbi:septal ring lytic transglycosylase RlpA family protein [Pseudoalteromonas denitrificans]|uniref:Endolytic peptidoglycan transglycosylase RlpA n=1 Tax=Pseudoalteromonas denitrificans DSM 6059 TaxID=1123010 RepID=A0A1I1EZZ2_9GAMM|nr:septal ring lytic transglycosylase RlpA family protein [Pseudoalteromonas denitrificans]SFB92316.1 rare lipoprotein A [Pseudoalteromonas denitrificans DSM 6059]